MRKLVAVCALALSTILSPATTTTALSNWDSGFTAGLAGGWYVAYWSGGTATHFRVKVRCADGQWRIGNMVWTANTYSTYTCPAAYRPANSVTAEVFYN